MEGPASLPRELERFRRKKLTSSSHTVPCAWGQATGRSLGEERERAAGGRGGEGGAEWSLPKENMEARCRAEDGWSGTELSGAMGAMPPAPAVCLSKF